MSPLAADGAAATAEEWAGRFENQAEACEVLGSPLYGRLLRILASDCAAGGSTWDTVRPHAGLRFGQAGPLRLVAAAHRLALTDRAGVWAACLPSCGGVVPHDDAALRAAWSEFAAGHVAELGAGMGREVQTNEVARSVGLAYGAAHAGLRNGTRLVELGCSAGLNLRYDHYAVRIGSLLLGSADSEVQLDPEVLAPVGSAVGTLDGGFDPAAAATVPGIVERIGLDPHPLDVTTPDGAATLTSFLWPDQVDRIDRVRAAMAIAARVPADLRAVSDTAAALVELLEGPAVPTLVQHSIVWQYIPTDQRWRITAALEDAGRRATAAAPLAWLRFEPDEWDRTRVALWLRRWPDGGDRLLAQVDYHGRWIRPIPPPFVASIR